MSSGDAGPAHPDGHDDDLGQHERVRPDRGHEPPSHPEQVPDDDADDRPAPYLVPVPAAEFAGRLRRRRVLLHDPWAPGTRHDLVAVGEPTGGTNELDQTVAVLETGDYYRRRHLEHDVETTAVPLAHLWVERLYTRAELIPDRLRVAEPERPAGGGQARDPAVWIRETTRPPVRRLVRGDRSGARQLVGARVVYSNHEGFHQSIRIISEPYFHDFGWLPADLDDIDQTIWIQAVTCCVESDWALWVVTGHTPPSAGPLPLSRLFLD